MTPYSYSKIESGGSHSLRLRYYSVFVDLIKAGTPCETYTILTSKFWVHFN